MADGWIELFDVETDEAGVLFVFDRCEPVDYGCDVFPFFEVAFFRNRAVDAVEGLFADFAYLGLRGVDESAGRFVCEVYIYMYMYMYMYMYIYMYIYIYIYMYIPYFFTYKPRP